MRTCKVVFNVSDEFNDELMQSDFAYNGGRLRKVFKRNEQRERNLSETFMGHDNLKPYTYKTALEDLVAGDRVVVQAKDGYALATFIEYVPVVGDCVPKNIQLKWLINRVDFTAYDNVMFAEERKKTILAQMMERKKQLEETAIWDMLAEKDPAMKALLDELKDLNK